MRTDELELLVSAASVDTGNMIDAEILTEYCQIYENVKENTEYCCNIKLMMHAR